MKCNCKIDKQKFNFQDVPLDCEKTWAMISRGFTKGVFQIERQLGKEWSKKVRPKNIEELAALISLIRPGPLECISGDTQILRRRYKGKDNKWKYEYCRIDQLYKEFNKWNNSKLKGKAYDGLLIMSVDENNMTIFPNKIQQVVYTGEKKVYEIKLKLRFNNDNYQRRRFYNIKATKEHKFLTLEGWKELKDITSNDYIAVNNKNFNNISKKSNNNISNLCFLCPNHHRTFTEGEILKNKIIKNREKYRLPNTDDIRWVKFECKKLIGKTETFDIKVNGPHHNYIAGNFIVHNSGMSELYAKRKNGEEPVKYLHPALEPILKKTYGTLIYQEQALKIVRDLAGFSLEEADILRKGLGKKIPEIIAKIKNEFINKSKEKGIITKEEAEEIFNWIEKGQRYIFNLSHAISYAMLSYKTAYCKAHFPLEFFTSYLSFACYKQQPREEIFELIQDVRFFNLEVSPPNIQRKNIDFIIDKKKILFGLSHIKGIGRSAIRKIIQNADHFNTWSEFLTCVSKINRGVAESLIKSGACDCYNKSRNEMLAELHVVLGNAVRDESGKIKNVSGFSKKEHEFFLSKYGGNNDLQSFIKRMIEEKIPHGHKRQEILEKHIEQLGETHNDTNTQKAIAEKHYLGISLSCSAVDDVETKGFQTCLEAAKSINEIDTCGIIEKIRIAKTRKGKSPGQVMCFLTISDSTFTLDNIVVFPNCYQLFMKILNVDQIIRLVGEKKGSSIITNRIINII